MPQGRTQLVVNNRVLITPGALLTKAAKTQGSNRLDGATEQGFKLKKCKAAMSWSGKTDGDGGILVGIHRGLTAAEVAEFYEANPQFFKDPSDSEEGNRAVFPVWFIPEQGTDQWGTTNHNSLNEKLWNIKVPTWEFIEGRSLSWHAFNCGTGTLTSGLLILIAAIYVIEWLRD